MSSTEAMCFVAFAACGCAVAACVDGPEYRKDTAKSVAEWIRKGLNVEKRSVVWVRANMRACRHNASAPTETGGT